MFARFIYLMDEKEKKLGQGLFYALQFIRDRDIKYIVFCSRFFSFPLGIAALSCSPEMR